MVTNSAISSAGHHRAGEPDAAAQAHGQGLYTMQHLWPVEVLRAVPQRELLLHFLSIHALDPAHGALQRQERFAHQKLIRKYGVGAVVLSQRKGS